MMLAWKVAPAIACGNAVVVKSAEQTPLSALYFGKLVQEAGAPPGLINILSGYGKEAGAALAEHMDVDKVAFTGSTATGRTIMKAASANLKNITLECGGKSPSIVFADANLEQAVKWTHSGGISFLSFSLFSDTVNREKKTNDIFLSPPLFGLVGLFNQGEVCTATTRIYVEESIHDQFVEEFIKYTKSTSTVGHPFDEATFQGPQVSQAQYEKVLDFIEVGKQEGAKVEMGGGAFKAKEGGGGGYFIEPTVFSNVSSPSPLSPLHP